MVVAVDTSSDRLATVRGLVELRLQQLVPSTTPRDLLNGALRHSLLAPGKRLRPSMAVLIADELGAVGSLALDPACAIEMVHTASLIVDDLPCMDNAELRRGNETSHVRFGPETALLASISLLNRAPAVISQASGLDAATRLELIEGLAAAVGDCCGLAAGQMKDLHSTPGAVGVAELETIVREKTAGLFVCAADAGARVAGSDPETSDLVRRFAGRFGICFQILDDIGDLESSVGVLGKDVGQDSGKPTYATLLGTDAARAEARRLADEAYGALDELGLADSSVGTLVDSALVSL